MKHCDVNIKIWLETHQGTAIMMPNNFRRVVLLMHSMMDLKRGIRRENLSSLRS
jgi:hypothetical protein